MGASFSRVMNVANFGLPYSMDTMLQHLGTAGTKGKESTHLLLFDNRQLRNVNPKMLTYVRNPNAEERFFYNVTTHVQLIH